MSRVNPTPASRSKFDEGRLMQVLVAPIVSEKATHVADKTNAVTFKVLQDATKPEIKKAVETLFSTKVADVRVANVHGKTKRQGRYVGKRPDWKKAYVVLKKGEKMIEFFEQA